MLEVEDLLELTGAEMRELRSTDCRVCGENLWRRVPDKPLQLECANPICEHRYVYTPPEPKAAAAPPEPRAPAAPPKKTTPLRLCTVCGGFYATTKAGLMRRHRASRELRTLCPGSLQPPGPDGPVAAIALEVLLTVDSLEAKNARYVVMPTFMARMLIDALSSGPRTSALAKLPRERRTD